MSLMDEIRAPSTDAELTELTPGVIFGFADARRIEDELPYAGAVTPREAWQLIAAKQATLVDVRTPPEFKFVGNVPGSVNVEWRGNDILPSATFVTALRRVAALAQPLLLICRSGVRSHAAARAASAAGFARVYNVLEGFEGQRSHAGQRGGVDGWRRHGLPWTQD